MKILFIGDLFGNRSLDKFVHFLPNYKKQNDIDFVILQGENVSGRKGLLHKDYLALEKCGVDAITMGNHVWAKDEINSYIESSSIIRPYNIESIYPGKGTKVFNVKDSTLRVTSFLGISFNKLNTPWKQDFANNFFDSFDELNEKVNEDFHIIDFHAETTSEKNVFGLYVDGKVSAFVGTHTHVQTNDARILPNGTLYITDVGMTGPINSAIGAKYETVYKKMRFPTKKSRFLVSGNDIEFNAVILELSSNKNNNKITSIRKLIN